MGKKTLVSRPPKHELEQTPRGIEHDHGWWVSLDYAMTYVGGFEWWNTVGYEDTVVPVRQYDTDSDNDDDEGEGSPPRDKPIWMYENGNMYLGPWIRLKKGQDRDIPLEHGFGTMYMHTPEKFRGQIYIGNWYQGRWHNMGKTSYLPNAPTWISNRLPKSAIRQVARSSSDDEEDHANPKNGHHGGKLVARPFVYMGLFEYGCMMDPEGAKVVLKDGTTRLGVWYDDRPSGDWWDHEEMPPALDLLAASIPPSASSSTTRSGRSKKSSSKANDGEDDDSDKHPKHRLLHKNKKRRSKQEEAATKTTKKTAADIEKTKKSDRKRARSSTLNGDDVLPTPQKAKRGPGRPRKSESEKKATTKKKSKILSRSRTAVPADKSSSRTAANGASKHRKIGAQIVAGKSRADKRVGNSKFDDYRGHRGLGGWWISLAEAQQNSCGGEEWWTATDIHGKNVAIVKSDQSPKHDEYDLDRPVWRFENGDMYLGKWVYNDCVERCLEDGYGIMYNHSPESLRGLIYVGQWKEGFCHGSGKSFWLPSCSTWKTNLFDGSQIVKKTSSEDASMYQDLPFAYCGQFVYGRKSGEGATVTLKDGTSRVGPWDDGYPVGDWWTAHEVVDAEGSTAAAGDCSIQPKSEIDGVQDKGNSIIDGKDNPFNPKVDKIPTKVDSGEPASLASPHDLDGTVYLRRQDLKATPKHHRLSKAIDDDEKRDPINVTSGEDSTESESEEHRTDGVARPKSAAQDIGRMKLGTLKGEAVDRQ